MDTTTSAPDHQGRTCGRHRLLHELERPEGHHQGKVKDPMELNLDVPFMKGKKTSTEVLIMAIWEEWSRHSSRGYAASHSAVQAENNYAELRRRVMRGAGDDVVRNSKFWSKETRAVSSERIFGQGTTSKIFGGGGRSSITQACWKAHPFRRSCRRFHLDGRRVGCHSLGGLLLGSK